MWNRRNIDILAGARFLNVKVNFFWVVVVDDPVFDLQLELEYLLRLYRQVYLRLPIRRI